MPRGTQNPNRSRGAFLLDEWLVEPDLSTLSRGDERVHVEIKVMEVLVHLACHSSQVVTRRQIIDDVWAGGFISDNTLTHAIAGLRRALGDDAGNPEYIATIHRRGYRLLKPVTDLDGRSSVGFGRPSRYRVLLDNRNVQLREGENLIGRLPEANLCVNSVQVSRRHARIIVENSNVYLEELGSKNGTQLNGRQIQGRTPLCDGDRISLGDDVVVMQFIEAADTTPTDPPDAITPTSTLFEA